MGLRDLFSAPQKDPVCHMAVRPQSAAGASEHGGKAYYFCSTGCKTKFDAAPAKYLQ